MEPFAVFLAGLLGLLALMGLVALGFAVLPKPYAPPGQERRPGAARRAGTEPGSGRGEPPEPQPLDPDLPAPVRRHFADTLGSEQVLPVQTAAAWGRGRVCLGGVWMPLRFKSFYRVGHESLRRYEITWYGQRLVTGLEQVRDGRGTIELGGRTEQGPAAAQAINLALWADAVWFPAALVSGLGWQVVSGPPESDWSERLPRWEALDDASARLIIPLAVGDGFRADQLLVYFDPLTGRMTHLAGWRARRGERPPSDAETFGGQPGSVDPVNQAGDREPWRMDLLAWGRVPLYTSFNPPGVSPLLPVHTGVGWGESGAIGAYWTIEGLAYNMDVGEWI